MKQNFVIRPLPITFYSSNCKYTALIIFCFVLKVQLALCWFIFYVPANTVILCWQDACDAWTMPKLGNSSLVYSNLSIPTHELRIFTRFQILGVSWAYHFLSLSFLFLINFFHISHHFSWQCICFVTSLSLSERWHSEKGNQSLTSTVYSRILFRLYPGFKVSTSATLGSLPCHLLWESSISAKLLSVQTQPSSWFLQLFFLNLYSQTKLPFLSQSTFLKKRSNFISWQKGIN